MEDKLNDVISNMDDRITNVVNEIKRIYGIRLELDSDFPGIRELGLSGKLYFNIILPDRGISRSRLYRKLVQISGGGIISDVKPNGVKRVSIFIYN